MTKKANINRLIQALERQDYKKFAQAIDECNFNEATSAEAYQFTFVLLANERKFHSYFESRFGSGRVKRLKEAFVNSNTRSGLSGYRFNDSMMSNFSKNLTSEEFKKVIYKYLEALAHAPANQFNIEYIDDLATKYMNKIDCTNILYLAYVHRDPEKLTDFLKKFLLPLNNEEKISFIREHFSKSPSKNTIALYHIMGAEYIEENFQKFAPQMSISHELVNTFFEHNIDLNTLKHNIENYNSYAMKYFESKLNEQRAHREKKTLDTLFNKEILEKPTHKL